MQHVKGIFAITGTGAVSTRAPTVAGTGLVPRTGTGAVTIPASTVAASGSTVAAAGTGAVTVPAPTVSGDGTVIWVSLFTAHVEIDTRDWWTPKVVDEEWTTR